MKTETTDCVNASHLIFATLLHRYITREIIEYWHSKRPRLTDPDRIMDQPEYWKLSHFLGFPIECWPSKHNVYFLTCYRQNKDSGSDLKLVHFNPKCSAPEKLKDIDRLYYGAFMTNLLKITNKASVFPFEEYILVVTDK